MKINISALDQVEAQTLCQKLQLHNANLRGLAAAAGHVIAAPTLTGDLLGNVRALEANCTECEAVLGNSAPGFNPAPAPSYHAAQAASVTGRKPTLTEQILSARGVKTLAELNAKSHVTDPAD